MRAWAKKRLRSQASGGENLETQVTAAGSTQSADHVTTLPHRPLKGSKTSESTVSEPNKSQHARYSSENNSGVGRRDFWAEAYNALRDKNPSLVSDYEQILASKLRKINSIPTAVVSASAIFAPPGTTESHLQMRSLVERKVEEQEEAVLKLKVGQKTIVVHEQIEKAVKVLMFAKSFVSSAVATDPHASLAWSGITILLPLLVNPGKQYKANIAGITTIATLIHRLMIVEHLYNEQKEDPQSSHGQIGVMKVLEDLGSALVKLYGQILEYQALSICQMSRSTISQIARDMVAWDTWDKLLSEIRESEGEVERSQGILDSLALRESFLKQERILEDKLTDFRRKEKEELKLEQSLEECLELLQSSENDYEAVKDRNAERVPGTCEWFLRHPKYCNWLSSPSSALLLVTADPGCGKSVLSKYLIDSKKFLEASPSAIVCYFFFKDENAYTSSALKGLGAILYQIFCQKPSLLRHALRPYNKKGKAFVGQFQELWKLFLDVVLDKDAETIICVFDALDECESDSRNPFIQHLASFYQRTRDLGRLKIIITSRPYDHIRDTFFFAGLNPEALILAGENDQERDEITKEVGLVIESKIASLKRLREWKTKEQDDAHRLIQERILSVPNRTYLWVSLIFPELERHAAASWTDLANILASIPLTINSAYEKILRQSLDEVQARKVLHIVLSAVQPLFLDEINIALHVNGNGNFECKPRASFRDYLRQLCGLFIHVIDDKVYLFHQSGRDFLAASSEASTKTISNVWQNSFQPSDSHRVLMLACIWYLQSSTFSTGSWVDSDSRPGTILKKSFTAPPTDRERNFFLQHKFLIYASINWGYHYRIARVDSTLLNLSRNLCKFHSGTWKSWFRVFSVYAIDILDLLPAIDNELVLRTFFGHRDAVQAILEEIRGGRAASDQEHDSNALYIACRYVREDIAQLLLQHGVPPLQKHLSVAFQISGWSLVRLFLDFGVSLKGLAIDEIMLCTDLEILNRILEPGKAAMPIWFEAIGRGSYFPTLAILERYFKTTAFDKDICNSLDTSKDVDMDNPLWWRDEDGNTAIQVYLQNCDFDTDRIFNRPHEQLLLLLDYYKLTAAKDRLGFSKIPIPYQNMSLELIKLCLEHKINPVETTPTQDTLLHIIVKLIVDYYASGEASEYVIKNDEVILLLCLNLGFDPTIQNADGRTPSDVAYEPHLEIEYGLWSDDLRTMRQNSAERYIDRWLHFKVKRIRNVLEHRALPSAYTLSGSIPSSVSELSMSPEEGE